MKHVLVTEQGGRGDNDRKYGYSLTPCPLPEGEGEKRHEMAQLQGNRLLEDRQQLRRSLDDFSLGVDRDEGG